MVMLVCISVRQYCEIEYQSGKINLGTFLSKWLDDHKAWEGLCGEWGTDCDDQDLRPLQTWANIDNEWAVFKFNDDQLALLFKSYFSDWNKTHQHRVILQGVRYNHRSIDSTEIGKWLRERDLANTGDYSFAPYVDEGMAGFTTAFEFKDPRIATMFKLTFGGARV